MQSLYESLLTYNIMEGVFKDTPSSIEQCREYFDNNIIKGENIPDEFIDLLFSIWQDNFEQNPLNIPFRCDGKHIKLSEAYRVFFNDILDLQKRVKGCSITEHPDRFVINKCVVKWGEGSLRGNRAEKGLGYEDVVVEQLIRIIQLIAGEHKNGKLNQKQFESIISDSSLNYWFALYDGGGLNEVLDKYIKNPDGVDLSSVVIKTGGGNVHRNDHNELYDDDFNVTNSDIEKVLKASGDIIADVTIKTKNPVYISVKMKASQLSGVTYQRAMAKNETFKQAVLSQVEWDDVKDDKEMIPFNNFCKVIGLDPYIVFSKYKDIYNGDSGVKTIEVSRNYDPKLLGCLFQKLLGGNYWYVKPDVGICEYVDYKDAKLSFNISKANISDSGKGITITGDIDGLKSTLTFRTDGNKTIGPWPYRLFPSISVPKLIEKLSK